MTKVTLHVSKAKVDADKLQAAIESIWGDLKSSKLVRDEAVQAGIDLKALDGKSNPFTVEGEGQGIDPVTTALVVAFAPLGAKILSDVWTHIVLPRLIAKFGAGVTEVKRD